MMCKEYYILLRLAITRNIVKLEVITVIEIYIVVCLVMTLRSSVTVYESRVLTSKFGYQ